MQPQVNLDHILRTHKILLDTSFAMARGFPEFCTTYADIFGPNPILMPSAARRELLKLSRSTNPEKCAAAQKALQTTDAMEHEARLNLRDEPGDSFTDLVIQRVVEQHLLKHDFCVLTNDAGLMQDLYAKLHKHSVKRVKDIVVVKLHGRTHEPVLFSPRAATASSTSAPTAKPFSVASKLAEGIDVPLDVKRRVKTGSSLYTSDGKKVKLERELAHGGEGTVFDIDARADVCKVYHQEKLTVAKEQKVSLMVARQLSEPALCWPIDVVRDSDGVFRGFIMPRARGHSLRETLFVPRLFLEENPSWTRRESVRLAITILERIDCLHGLNVLIGDINELNILMVDQNEVYFVDCDSYQVEGYPCPVGTTNFTAPEIQGHDFRGFLRAKEHELFAVATLLFMILHPGKCPYSHQGGEDGAANIIEGHFPYPLGEDNPSDRVPRGYWRFCWSHLNYGLKKAFYGVFHRDYLLQQRVPLKQWLRLLRRYQAYLRDDRKVVMGPSREPGFDLSILPENFRRLPGKDDFDLDGKTDLEVLTRRLWLRDNRGRRSSSSRPTTTPTPRKGPAAPAAKTRRSSSAWAKTAEVIWALLAGLAGFSWDHKGTLATITGVLILIWIVLSIPSWVYIAMGMVLLYFAVLAAK